MSARSFPLISPVRDAYKRGLFMPGCSSFRFDCNPRSLSAAHLATGFSARQTPFRLW